MTRFLIAGALALAASVPALAQDMPLSQILIDGEGWKKGEKLTADERKGLKDWKASMGLAGLSALALSPDKCVGYAVRENVTYIAAFQTNGPEGKEFWGENEYCPLRIKRGETAGGCTALCEDKEGRIYAATPIGIQVFDPLGRLCGVTTAPAGRADFMAFEGDKLTLWIGDTKYVRKLNTQGAKGALTASSVR